ncbi:MAG: ABC transporter permease [Gammaproteobacteria bacterium]|nr:MAG: ABC transporter permease [Gammaproteobacteria bacterium]
MSSRLALTSFFLGILTVFVGWAFQWALDEWKEITFDLPGEVTALRVIEGPQPVSAAAAETVQDELKTYFREHSLALVVASFGNDRPEMLVYDPLHLVPWFPGCPSSDSQSVTVYLFRGTYSEHLWLISAPNPFLPPGAVIKGVIAAPRRADNLQYARCSNHGLLPEGQYTFNTTDPTQVRHVLELVRRMGLVPQASEKMPFFLFLLQTPLIVITVFFLVAGYGCVMLYWFLYVRGRASEFGIRARHGALPLSLTWENLARGMPALVIGSGVGGLFASVLVSTIGQINLSSQDIFTLVIAMSATVIVTALMWLIMLFIVIRSQYEVNLAG